MTDHIFALHKSRKNMYVFTTRQSQMWYGVCWACHYCQLMISLAHCRISASPLLPTKHTAVIFSNWWHTWSASGLTGILFFQIASMFVIIGHGRTTSSKVAILACIGEFKLPTLTCSAFWRTYRMSPSTTRPTLQRMKCGIRIRRPMKKSNLQNDTRIKACITRYDAVAYSKLQFLCTISHRLGIHSARFLAEEVSDDDGVNVDEQQQHSGPATCATAAADATSAQSATCEVCHLVRHFPVLHFPDPVILFGVR